jgi:hypothetical protein
MELFARNETFSSTWTNIQLPNFWRKVGSCKNIVFDTYISITLHFITIYVVLAYQDVHKVNAMAT